ncbi:MAG: VWA domain-containing protein [Oligoflexales bacterium]
MMRLYMSVLCIGLSLGSSALALKLPNKTMKKTEFTPASNSLSSQDDFKGQENEYKELALHARKNPEKINALASEMVEDENPAEKEEIKEYVASELRKEALARQYVLLIDKSASMGSYDKDGGVRGDRWGAAEKATKGLVDAMFKNDMDHKVPSYLFGHNVETIGELTDSHQVMQLFKEHDPDGRNTNLSDALSTALEDHIGMRRNNYEVVPGTTIVVITDGAPNSEDRVRTVLQKYANPENGYIKNDEELAITFIQIGDDEGARLFLKSMDKGWSFGGRKMDICDTKKDDDLRRMGPEKILEEAIFD